MIRRCESNSPVLQASEDGSNREDTEDHPDLQAGQALHRPPESGLHFQAKLQRTWSADSLCFHRGMDILE